MDLKTKREQEKRIVGQMTRLYCRGVHGGKALCQSCVALLDHACQRIDSCPFVETRTFCVSCKVHCYKPQMREQIRTIALRRAADDILSSRDGHPASDGDEKGEG